MSSQVFSKRLVTEASCMKNNPPENCSASPSDNDQTKWDAIIIGPKNSPFEGGIFNLKISFPKEYPFKAPHIKFVTQMYHPNIDTSGEICLDILKNQWSPALSMSSILLSICSLLTDPNPNDPLRSNVANVYKQNKEEYEKTVKEYTLKYASGNPVVDNKNTASENYSDDESD